MTHGRNCRTSRRPAACATRRESQVIGGVPVPAARVVLFLCIAGSLTSSACTGGRFGAQNSGAGSKDGAVDRSKVLEYKTVLRDHNGNRIAHVAGVMFGVYEQQEGGAPLWMEVQNVTPDKRGHFEALVGSTKKDGIPSELFDGEKTLWLGIQVLEPGETEQRRIRLVKGAIGLRTTRLVLPEGSDDAASMNAAERTSSDAGSEPQNPNGGEAPHARRRRFHGLPVPQP